MVVSCVSKEGQEGVVTKWYGHDDMKGGCQLCVKRALHSALKALYSAKKSTEFPAIRALHSAKRVTMWEGREDVMGGCKLCVKRAPHSA